ncbi:broad-complex core protein isoforms 1/2/3/4/5 isoform X6 [Athalia rosae]|uniref:broad-complex core protein isoforms 1/2/3/4/5 isoform X6 n=1 Tax=Athalia rosae TaxID=37344 RepID=UPI0020334CD5|nr:broad-complex core protein isoforms 1/2/3/4/5 isoform X6 [Athalia rosae]
MVDTQHFCLRWNNYQSSITSAFENLRDDEDFVDVTLACDGKSLKAHRVVLSACSPYFRELLKSTPCKHPVIVLQDVAFSDLHALVEFIYHGEVNVHQRSLSSFLKTAEVLRVSGLTQQSDQTDRDELSHVRALAAGNHVPSHEKLPDEGFPSGNSPPPTPATPVSTTMQQLFRRSQIRKSEAHTFEPHNENVKRPRLPSPPLNNNDATPTDFSMMKSNHLSSKIEGNGLNEDSSHIEENIKCEPLELTGGNGGAGGNHDDSSDSGAAASDRPPASASSNEHDPEPEHAPTPNFLTPESKLFTPGAYNFSMHALTDHSSMSGLGHGLQTPDLAGTSQGTGNGMQTPTTLPSAVYRMPPPTAGGINEPQECPYCRRTFSCYYSLKRHFQDKHEQSDTLYVCEFCNRRYRTKNSLTTHKSLQHRGSSGMLKRLLKTSAIKNVLAQHPQIPQQPQ